jgi:hypothetical protein
MSKPRDSGQWDLRLYEPSRQHESRPFMRFSMTHIGWDRTAMRFGGSVLDLLDGPEDHRRGALD